MGHECQGGMEYTAQTTAEEHLKQLMDKLGYYQEIQERLEAHRAARQILAKYAYVDDLEEAIDILEHQDPVHTQEGPRLHAVLLGEKRDSLGRERARFEHDLQRSRFGTVAEASRACLSDQEVKRYEDELNSYREDYAFTLAKCQAGIA